MHRRLRQGGCLADFNLYHHPNQFTTFSDLLKYLRRRAGLTQRELSIGVGYSDGQISRLEQNQRAPAALFREQGDRWGLAFSLAYLGMAIRDQEDFALARSRVDESVALWRDLGDVWGLGLALSNSGEVALRQGDYETVRSRHDEALAARKAIGDKWGMARSLGDVGWAMFNLGDEARARPFLEESLTLFREMGDQFSIALNLKCFGTLALYDGDEALAQSYFTQALDLARDEVGPKWLKGDCLKGFAGLAAVRGQAGRRARLWGAVEAQLAAAASYMDNSDCISFGRTLVGRAGPTGRGCF